VKDLHVTRLERNYFWVHAQRAALLALCAMLAIVVSLTYLYDHPITRLRLWRGSFPDLIVAVGLLASWPYVCATILFASARRPSLTRAIGCAVILIASAGAAVTTIVLYRALISGFSNMLLFTGLQWLCVACAWHLLGPADA